MDSVPPYLFNQPAPPPRRTGWIVYSVIVTFFLFLSVLANLVLFAAAFGRGTATDGLSVTTHRGRYQEQYVEGEEDAKDKIAVIYVTGVINSSEDGYSTEDGMVGDIEDQLQQAVDDKHVKAIILKIDSPGGEVVASDTIYQAVVDAREKKKVVAYIDTMGASGAYYVAVAADYIVANELSITGSIGVIMESFTFDGLADKVGIKFYTFKSGKYKDILNPTREPTEDEKALVQGMVMEVYDKFVGIVAQERDMKVDDLKNGLADGRILSGKQALDAGFVDELGYFEDAIGKAEELASIKKARVIRYVEPFSLRNLFRFMGNSNNSSSKAKIQIELTPNEFKLQTGHMYFLPSYMFH
ncbi:MAG TPA: signal peptide peptidase SppA [Verrucomicrobiae bacterium]|nr:signal peptide peptidase SppA [Verrucomicrobiae bacterium]